MNSHRFIRWLLAVFVIIGLVVAPLVTSSAAKQLPLAGMSDMAAMTGDMPCCPDGQKDKSCPDCPLLALCMLAFAQAEPSVTDAVQVSFQGRRLFFVIMDLLADGLIAAPPDYPPRILT